MGTHTPLLRAGVHPGQCSSCACVGSEGIERPMVGIGSGCTVASVQFWCTATFFHPRACSSYPPASPLLVPVGCAQNIRIGCSGTEAALRTCCQALGFLLSTVHRPPQDLGLCHWVCDACPILLSSSSRREVSHWSFEVTSFPVPLASAEAFLPATQPAFFLGRSSAHCCCCRLQQALNTCIGSSGARAVGYRAFTATSDWLYLILIDTGCSLATLAHSILFALLLLLVALLFRPFGLPSSPLGLLCGAYILGVQVRPLVSLSVASPSQPVLDWSPWRNRKGKIPLRRSAPGLWLRSLTWVLLWLSIPESVTASRLPTPVWVLLPSAYAMTRPERPDHPPGLPYSQRWPHLIPPDELTTHVGVCDYACMSDLCEPVDVSLESDRLPQITLENRDEGSEWLGVHLMTPHYKTVTLAIRPPERTMRSALDTLVQRFPSPSAVSPDRVFDTVVPAHPQRSRNFGTFLRFSSSIRAVGVGGQTAIIVDLSHVGGHYFSAILPREIAHQELLDYLVPLSKDDDAPLLLYIGYQTEPSLPGQVVQLYDGVVVTALRHSDGPPLRYRAEDLFAVDSTWCHPRSMFRMAYHEAICVLHQNRRYTLPHHHHYGRTSVEYVSTQLRLEPHSTAMCSFPLGDLDVQGELCAFVIAVADVPSPRATGMTREGARDIFVLLDPRPLGCKPHFLLLQYPTVHLPTIIAHLGLSTSPAARIGVAGGTRRGDEIHVYDNATLLLFAEMKPLDDSDSSSSSPSQQVSSWEEELVPAVEGPLPGDQLSEPAIEPDDVWGQLAGSPSRMTQQFVDPTLPPGQSWNEGVPEATPEETPQDPSPASADRSGTQGADMQSHRRSVGRRRHRGRREALVYVPDFVPEIVEVDVSEPVTCPTLIVMIQGRRLEEQSSSFPELYPVSPQPVQHFPIFVATPNWLVDTVVILCDCLGYDGTIFAKVVSVHTSRESLMLVAGIPTDAPVNVWAHRSMRPLSVDQSVLMSNGSTVQFVPWRTDAPPCYDFEQVSALDNWVPDSPLPGPRTHFNGYFWILSDDRPFPFEVQPDRRSSFKQDVAASLGVPADSLTLKPSTPRVVDSFPFGFWASGILVATRKLSRVPHPPIEQPETRCILILDQRRMLRGMAWRLVKDGVVTVQEIADIYYDTCPSGYEVSIRGADVYQLDGEEAFQIQDGQVLVVEFTPEPVSPVIGPDHPAPSDTPAPSDDGIGGPPATVVAHRAGASGPQPHPPARQRSHSPRPAAQDQVFKAYTTSKRATELASLVRGIPFDVLRSPNLIYFDWGLQVHRKDLLRAAFGVVKSDKVNMWSLDRIEHALAESSPSLTSVLLSLDTRLALVAKSLPGLGQLLDAGSHCRGKACKLLDEPRSGTPADTAVDGARTAVRLLNTPWPFPPFQWPAAQDLDADMQSEDSQAEVRVTIDVVVFLLTPDYVPEQLDLTVELPQSVQDLIDLVQVCRDRDRHSLFPLVVEVMPQPDPGWGIFLAIPSWVHEGVVLCLDLSLFDGRIFAVSLPDRCSKHLLCEAAGLAPTAEVDIFVPGMPFALLSDTDCYVQMGMCLTFVRVGRQRPPTFSLPAMLCTHIPWEHSPVFPRDRLDNGVCAVGPRGQVLFRLHPERAFYYRADIALMTELHPLRVVLTPAAPQPTDVCVRGWSCRAVVGATDRQERTVWNGDIITPTVGLVDGRPLLRGWITVSTWDSWLDLAPIRQIFEQFVPPGWQVVFPGLPAHWTWLCFAPGQILTVALAPVPAPSGTLQPGVHPMTEVDTPAEAALALFGPATRSGAPVPPAGSSHESEDRGPRGRGHHDTRHSPCLRSRRPAHHGAGESHDLPLLRTTRCALLGVLCVLVLHAAVRISLHNPIAIYACLLPRHGPLCVIGGIGLSFLLDGAPCISGTTSKTPCHCLIDGPSPPLAGLESFV